MCVFPTAARLNPDGGRPILDKDGDLKLPCSKCHECKKLNAVGWGTRVKHECSMHDENTFITLTYDEENLPGPLLVKDEFQKFMKRLRKKTKRRLSYIVSHEYGSKTFRPHHHAIIFGWEPKEQKYLMDSPKGMPLFTSNELTSLWDKGFHSIGEANEKTAYYIASYSLKGKEHKICMPNGQYITVSDQFDTSKRPGIGLEYLKRNYKTLINAGEVLPRYYVDKLKDIDEDAYSTYHNNLLSNIKENSLQERISKIKINQAQENLTDPTFRQEGDNTYQDTHLRYLKNERSYSNPSLQREYALEKGGPTANRKHRKVEVINKRKWQKPQKKDSK